MHTNESTSIMIATNNTNKRRRTTFPFDHCKVCNDKATGFHYGGKHLSNLILLIHLFS